MEEQEKWDVAVQCVKEWQIVIVDLFTGFQISVSGCYPVLTRFAMGHQWLTHIFPSILNLGHLLKVGWTWVSHKKMTFCHPQVSL